MNVLSIVYSYLASSHTWILPEFVGKMDVEVISSITVCNESHHLQGGEKNMAAL